MPSINRAAPRRRRCKLSKTPRLVTISAHYPGLRHCRRVSSTNWRELHWPGHVGARLADTASLFQSMGEVAVARKHSLFLD
jgi:hypothetical protein